MPQDRQPKTELTLDDFRERARERYGIPKGLWEGVRGQESGGDPNAVSPTGVRGEFQVTKKTAAGYGLDRDDPFHQITAAAKNLREGYDRYSHLKDDNERWLAAAGYYYGGPDAVGKDGALNAGSKDQLSTPADYVTRVAQRWKQFNDSQPAATPTPTPRRRQQQAKPPAKPPEPVAETFRKLGMPAEDPAGYDKYGRPLTPQHEAFRRKPMTEQLTERAVGALTRGGGQLSKAARQAAGFGVGVSEFMAGKPFKVADFPEWREAEERKMRILEEERRARPSTFATEVGEGIIEALPTASAAILGTVASGGSLPAAMGVGGGLAAAGADWRNPKRAATQTALGAVAPVVGGRIGQKVGGAVASRLARPAAQTAARAGGELVGGGAGNVLGHAGEVGIFEGSMLTPREAARDALIGVALNVPGAAGAARRARPPAGVADRALVEEAAIPRPRIPAPGQRRADDPGLQLVREYTRQAADTERMMPPGPERDAALAELRQDYLAARRDLLPAAAQTQLERPPIPFIQRRPLETIDRGAEPSRQTAELPRIPRFQAGQTTELPREPQERRTVEIPRQGPPPGPPPQPPPTPPQQPPPVPDVNQRLIDNTKARAEDLIQNGQFDEAVAELKAHQKALKDAQSAARKAPGMRTQLERQLGQAATRIGQVRQMARGAAKQPKAPGQQQIENAPTTEAPRLPGFVEEPTNRITEGEGAELPRRVSRQLEGQPVELPQRRPPAPGRPARPLLRSPQQDIIIPRERRAMVGEGRRIGAEIEAGRGEQGAFGRIAQQMFKSTQGSVPHGQDAFFHDPDVKGALGITRDAEMGEVRAEFKKELARSMGVKADEISLTQVNPAAWESWARQKRLGGVARAKMKVAIQRYQEGVISDIEKTAPAQAEKPQQPETKLRNTPAENGREIRHYRFGKVAEAADQSDVKQGYTRVVGADGRAHIIKNPRVSGNREASFVKKEEPPDIIGRMSQLARTPTSPVEASKLRAEFPEMSKADFDAEMTRLNEQGKIALHRHDYPQSLREAQRNELIQIGDDYFTAATLREAEPKPAEAPEAPEPKPKAKVNYTIPEEAEPELARPLRRPAKPAEAPKTEPKPEPPKAEPKATEEAPKVEPPEPATVIKPTHDEETGIIVKSRREKPGARTGLTKSQEAYLADKLKNDVLPQFVESSAEKPIRIEVPGDGRFTVKNVEQANNLAYRLTGKPLEKGFRPTVKPFNPNISTGPNIAPRPVPKTRGEYPTEVESAIPIDAYRIGGAGTLSEPTVKTRTGTEEGWATGTLEDGRPVYTDGHIMVVGKPPAKHATNKAIAPELLNAIFKGNKAKGADEPAVFFTTEKSGDSYVAFKSGQVVNAKYFDHVMQAHPNGEWAQVEVKVGDKPAPMLVRTLNGEPVAALMPLQGDKKGKPFEIPEHVKPLLKGETKGHIMGGGLGALQGMFERGKPTSGAPSGRDVQWYDYLASPLSNLNYKGTYERIAGSTGKAVSEAFRRAQIAIAKDETTRGDQIRQLERAMRGYKKQLRAEGKPGLANWIDEHINALHDPDAAFRGLAGFLKAFQYHTKLRFNPRSIIVNELQPLQTLWPHLSTGEFLKIAAQARRKATRGRVAELAARESGGKVEEVDRSKKRIFPDPFAKVSESNHIMGHLAGELMADKQGLTGEAKARMAADWAKKVEFDNSRWDIPPLFRGRIAGVLGQFKPFTVKNLERLYSDWKSAPQGSASGKLARRAKMITSQLAIGGVRSALLFPVKEIGGVLILGGLAKALQKSGMEADDADKLAETIYFGAPGLIEQDLSSSVMLLDAPFGGTPAEKAVNFFGGPTSSLIVKAWKEGQVMANARDTAQGTRKEKVEASALRLAKTITPAAKTGEAIYQATKRKTPTMKLGGEEVPMTKPEAVGYGLMSTPLRQTRFYEEEEIFDWQRRALGRPQKAGRLESFGDRFGDELRRHGLNYDRVDKMAGDTEESHRARAERVGLWMRQYGAQLVASPRYATLAPAEQKAAIETLRNRVGGEANAVRPRLSNFSAADIIQSVRRSERGRSARDRRKIVVAPEQ